MLSHSSCIINITYRNVFISEMSNIYASPIKMDKIRKDNWRQVDCINRDNGTMENATLPPTDVTDVRQSVTSIYC